MDGIRQLFAKLAEAWQAASTSGRLLIGASSAVTIIALIGVSIWSSMPDYKLLRDGIAPSETAAIVSALDAKGIPNKMNYSGTSVLVPASRWNEANVEIASLDVVATSSSAGRSGSIIPSPPGHEESIRARELALERSLEGLTVVKTAKVHLAIPKRSPFRKHSQSPSASVIVEAAPNQIISNETAQSIVQTVASSVEGLDPKRITLTDSGGRMIGGGHTDPATARREYIAAIEARFAMKAEDNLRAVLGPNRAVVRVTARVDDFLERTTTKEQISSNEKVRLKEIITSTNNQGLKSSPAGVPGTGSNGTDSATAAAGAQPVSGKTETNETTYDYPRSTEEVREIGGQVLKLSVIATVDATPPAETDESGQPVGPLMTTEEVEDIVKMVIGFDAARGDQVKVVMKKFSDSTTAAVDLAVPETQKWEFMAQLAKYASLGLTAISALTLTLLIVKRLKPIEIKTTDDNQRNELLSTLTSRVEQNPEAVSKLLAAWIGSQASPDFQQKAA